MQIIAVSQHLTRGPMADTIAQLGITYPVAVDSDRDTWGAYGMQVYPSWAFINPDGSLGGRSPGMVTLGDALALIEQHVGTS